MKTHHHPPLHSLDQALSDYRTGRELSLFLQSYPTGDFERVELKLLGEGRLQLRLGEEVYAMRLAGAWYEAPPPSAPEGGVTRALGYCEGAGGSSVRIVVNCGATPPRFAVTVAGRGMVSRPRAYAITHDVQHEIVEAIAETVMIRAAEPEQVLRAG